MRGFLGFFLTLAGALFSALAVFGQQPHFRVLAFYSENVESDHMQFAEGAVKFFGEIASKEHFAFEATSDWEN